MPMRWERTRQNDVGNHNMYGKDRKLIIEYSTQKFQREKERVSGTTVQNLLKRNQEQERITKHKMNK